MSRIEVTNLSVSFGGPLQETARIALSDVSVSVDQGEFVCLLGPSGCGKSTLLNAIGGLIAVSEGKIQINGKDVHRPGPDRGMVFQNYSLFPWLTVGENVGFGPSLHGWEKERRDKTTKKLIDLIGLNGWESEYPKALSGGMRQRVAIARALAMEPAVLLMDEPFGALDAQTRTRMQELLLDIWSRTKKTIVFVTHDVEEAIYLSDRVILMGTKPGRIVSELKIEIERPRMIDVVASHKFSQYRGHILKCLREQSVGSVE